MLAATPKDHSSFRKSYSKIVCIIWSRDISDFDANFGSILRILSPKPGAEGWCKYLEKRPKTNPAVFAGCLVYPSFWLSFIEIGVMACITPACGPLMNSVTTNKKRVHVDD